MLIDSAGVYPTRKAEAEDKGRMTTRGREGERRKGRRGLDTTFVLLRI